MQKAENENSKLQMNLVNPIPQNKILRGKKKTKPRGYQFINLKDESSNFINESSSP